jgi:putative serine protease PepD
MTAAAPARAVGAERGRLELWSVIAVTAMTLISVVAGLLLRTTLAETTRRVDLLGNPVSVPAGWVIAPPAGDALLSAHDPLDPDQRYVVERYDPAGLALDDAARQRLADRAGLLGGVTVIGDAPDAVGGVATQRLQYTFGDAATNPPVVIEAVEDHFPTETTVMVVRLEAPQAEFAAALDRYDDFRRQAVAALARASAAPPIAVDEGPATGAGADYRAAIALVGRGGPSLGRGPLVQAATADLVAATVQVQQLAVADDPSSEVGWGSGTVLTPDGLILTNAHVAMPSAAGLAIYDQDPTPVRDPAGLVIAVVQSEDQPPVPRYRARVLAADGYLDAALIRIDRNLDGSPVAPGSLRLPVVTLGDSDGLRVGDRMTVVGYPGIGGDTISLSSGEVSGFLGDARIGPRAWIKTDAVVSHGNSGGLAADAQGRIVGIPTRGNEDVGGYSLVRPIGLVRPMIDAVNAGGGSLDSRYVVAGTGTERLTFDTWSDSAADCRAGSRLTTYPSAARQVVGRFQQSAMSAGEDVVIEWRLDGRVVAHAGMRVANDQASGGCLNASLYSDRGLPDGRYRVELYVGPHLRDVAGAETNVGAGGAGTATLSGRVVDVDSRAPITGAVVYLLVPGTDPQAWYAAPSEDYLAGFGATGGDGRFRIGGLPTGEVYPAVVVADGYYPAAGSIGPLDAGENSLDGDITLGQIGP